MSATATIGNINQPDNSNLGSVKKLLFRPVRDISNIPEPASDHNITDDITFSTGNGFYQMYVTLDTASVSIEESIDDQGPVCQVTISGLVPGDSNVNQASFYPMSYDRFIVIAEDNNGVQRIAGNLNNGMRFTYNYTTQDAVSGRRGYEIEFTGQFAIPPYYYKSNVPVDATGFDAVEVTDDGTTIALTSGETYTCAKKQEILVQFKAGDDKAVITFTAFNAGTFTGESKDGNIGSTSYELDTGGGYSSLNFPSSDFSGSDGDKLRITRGDTANDGDLTLEGTHT